LLVTIPTCGESPHLGALVEACIEGGASVLVALNNANVDQEKFVYDQLNAVSPLHLSVLSYGEGLGLYEVWNECIKMCVGSAHTTGAILNDDIYIHPDSVAVIENSIKSGLSVVGWDAFTPVVESPVSNPRQVSGTYRTHGLAGFAFAFDPAKIPTFDTDYTWWYGDDDWVERVKYLGLPLFVEQECGVRHYPSTSQRARPWVMKHVEHDKSRFESKWGKK